MTRQSRRAPRGLPRTRLYSIPSADKGCAHAGHETGCIVRELAPIVRLRLAGQIGVDAYERAVGQVARRYGIADTCLAERLAA